jgi:hypothetical protein
MVTGRENVCALVEELVGDTRRDAKAAGGILRVDHHQVDLPLLDERGQVFTYDTPSGVPKDVTNKENAQKPSSGRCRLANDPATGTKWSWLPVGGTATLEVTNVPSQGHALSGSVMVAFGNGRQL